jgi:hypothetical protein
MDECGTGLSAPMIMLVDDLSQSKPVAGGGGGSKRLVLLVGGKQGLATPLVVRETPGSEHDAPARLDLHLPGRRFQYGAAHSVGVLQ